MNEDDRDKFFDRFNAEQEDRELDRQESFEERCVKYIVYRFAKPNWKAIKAEWTGSTDYEKLGFDWLRDYWPNFPLKFCTRKIPGVHSVTLPQIYKKPTTTPFFKAYVDAVSENGWSNEAVGLIFDWPKGGLYVLHNHVRADQLGRTTALLTFHVRGREYSLEHLEALLASIQWVP